MPDEKSWNILGAPVLVPRNFLVFRFFCHQPVLFRFQVIQ